MQTSQEQTPKQKFLASLSNLLHKYKTFLIVILVIIIVGVVIFAIASEIVKNRINTSTHEIEQVQDDYEHWLAAEEEDKKSELEQSILAETETIINRYSKLYAAQRAYFIRGMLHFDKNELEKAVMNFSEVVSTFPQSYLAPISLVNNAIALEESGKIEEAIDTYSQVIAEYRDSFPGIPEALFSLGRLYEKVGDFSSAFDVYSDLEDSFPSSNWTKLARNRIIRLKVDGKI